MAGQTLKYCPNCNYCFYAGGSVSYGPPLVKCSKCGTIIKTGWDKNPGCGSYFPFVLSIVLGSIGVLIPILVIIASGGVEDLEPIALVFLIGGGVLLFIGIAGIKNIRTYVKSISKDSDEIPTY